MNGFRKRTLDADNYLNILFSMIGVTEADKDDVYTKLAPKSTSSDRKKSITTLLFKRWNKNSLKKELIKIYCLLRASLMLLIKPSNYLRYR